MTIYSKDTNTKTILSQVQVSEAARNYAESIGWFCDSELVQQQPDLKYEQNKLVWDVFFIPLKEGLPVRSGLLRLLIDDATGKVIKETIGTR